MRSRPHNSSVCLSPYSRSNSSLLDIFSSLLDCLYSMIEFTVTLNHQSSHPPVHRITRRKPSSAAHPSSPQRHSPSWALKLLNRQNLSHTSAPQSSPKPSPASFPTIPHFVWNPPSASGSSITIPLVCKNFPTSGELFIAPQLWHNTEHAPQKTPNNKKQDSQKNVAHFFLYQIPN